MDKKLRVFIIRVLVFIVVAGALLWFFAFRSTDPAVPKEEQPSLLTPTGAVIPSAVYDYNGVVQEVKNKSIRLYVPAANNYLTEDITLNVSFDENTVFITNTVARRIVADGSRPQLITEPTGAEDLSIGQQVIVHSATDTSLKKNIVAERVMILK